MNDFFRAMAPHLTANLLTVVFVYAAITMWKSERAGFKPDTLSLALFAGVLVFQVYGLYLNGALEAFR